MKEIKKNSSRLSVNYPLKNFHKIILITPKIIVKIAIVLISNLSPVYSIQRNNHFLEICKKIKLAYLLKKINLAYFVNRANLAYFALI